MSREIDIEQKVCEYAESKGYLVRKCVYAGRRGAPDRWFFRNGRLILVEFKKPGGKLDGNQEREHQRLRNAGFPVHVIDDIEAGKSLFS